MRDAASSAKQLTRKATSGIMGVVSSPERIGTHGGSAMVAVGDLQSEESQKDEKLRAKRVQVCYCKTAPIC